MLSLYVYTNRKSGKILHTGHLSACPLPKSVHSWEPEGWERPPEDRKSVPAERLRPHLLHLPALRPVLPPGSDCPPDDGNVPHQVLQPQSQRLQRTRWTDSFVYLFKRLFTCQKDVSSHVCRVFCCLILADVSQADTLSVSSLPDEACARVLVRITDHTEVNALKTIIIIISGNK